MALTLDLAVQGAQMLLVLLLAPLFTGFVRKVKARLLRRRGAPIVVKADGHTGLPASLGT